MNKAAMGTLQGEIGVVDSVKNGVVTVRFPRKPMCEHCGACGVLSDSMLEMQTQVPDEGLLAAGDRVTLEVDRQYFMVSAWLLYGVPLAALLLGMVAGTLFWGDGLPTALLALGMAALSYTVLRLYDKKLRSWRKSHMRVEKIVDNPPDTEACIILDKGEGK